MYVVAALALTVATDLVYLQLYTLKQLCVVNKLLLLLASCSSFVFYLYIVFLVTPIVEINLSEASLDICKH